MDQSPPMVPRVLKPADCQRLNQLLASCNGTQCLLHALKQLGLPVDEQEQLNNWHMTFATQCKGMFFPEQP